jgi:hypothetical protein
LDSEESDDSEPGRHDKLQAVPLDDLSDLTMDTDELYGIEMTPMIGQAADPPAGSTDGSSRSRISAKLAAAGAKIAGAKGAIVGRKGSKYDRLTDLDGNEETDEHDGLARVTSDSFGPFGSLVLQASGNASWGAAAGELRPLVIADIRLLGPFPLGPARSLCIPGGLWAVVYLCSVTHRTIQGSGCRRVTLHDGS